MIKFIIRTVKGVTSIFEVECEEISFSEQPIYGWLKLGEWMGRITAPKILYENAPNGKLTPPIWCWHSFYHSLEEAQAVTKDLVKSRIFYSKKELSSDYTSISVSDEEVDEALSKVQIIRL